MKKRNARKAISLGGHPSFNWQIQEDTPRPIEPLAEQPSRRSPRRWLILLLCATLMLLGGYWGGQLLMQRAEANLAQVEAEVAQAITLPNTQSPPAVATTSAISASLASAQIDTNVTLLELNGSLALVDLVVNNPTEAWYSKPYRVARIMRQGVDGWHPITPTNTFWGERHTLETNYFHLDYSERDQEAAQSVAPLLDDLYQRFHSDLGLAAPARNKRMNILIAVVAGSDVRVTDLRYSGNTLIIPPPELLARPPDISDAETLRQAIAFPLSVKIFDIARSEYQIPCDWRAVSEGIGLWLQWEGHTLPSRRHWDYQTVIKEWSNPTAPPRLDDLLSIPRDCWQPPPFLEMEVLNSGRPVPRAELSATLIEYMVATYGRQLIPILLNNFGQSSDWNHLIETTVGVSAVEFEAGWQAYLATRQ